MSNLKNKVENAKDKVIGKTKESVGKATGNQETELKGKLQYEKGNLKENFYKTKEKVKDRECFSIRRTDNSINRFKIGFQIKSEREKFGMTRDYFAEILDISSYFLRQVERSERGLSVYISPWIFCFLSKLILIIILFTPYWINVPKRKLF